MVTQSYPASSMVINHKNVTATIPQFFGPHLNGGSMGDDVVDDIIVATVTVALRNDPNYSKYFKMLQVGVELDHVQHCMSVEGKDPLVIHLDPNRPLESHPPPPDNDMSEETVLFWNHSSHAEYAAMAHIGTPKQAILTAFRRKMKETAREDAKSCNLKKDTNATTLASGKKSNVSNITQQLAAEVRERAEIAKQRTVVHALILNNHASKNNCSNDSPLRYDPNFSKNVDILDNNAADRKFDKHEVRNKLIGDGKRPSILDLDPSLPLRAQQQSNMVTMERLEAWNNPDYSEYAQMLLEGIISHHNIKIKLSENGMDEAFVDFLNKFCK
mmetsp:Transcript_25874/g.29796  ORF Transcript_25874/g.29796 Transcript_25874/m.29796 type:complete len:329 (+) Transcript_25874:166-1152(+)